jgi:hypothetical protein
MGSAEGVGRRASTHAELEVWKRSSAASMRIFELSKPFPREEMYSLTDQIRRWSRSVTVNITEAWRRFVTICSGVCLIRCIESLLGLTGASRDSQ